MRCADASNKAIYSRSLNPKRKVIKKYILLPSVDYTCVKAKASYCRYTRYTNSNKVCVPISISNPLLATPSLIRFSSCLTSAPKLSPMLRRLRVTPATTTSCSISTDPAERQARTLPSAAAAERSSASDEAG